MNYLDILGIVIFMFALAAIPIIIRKSVCFFKSGKMLSKTIKTKLWLISMAFVTVSPFIIPTKIVSDDQLRILRFGLPFSYIEQHTLDASLAREFPFFTTIINPWGHSLAGNINIRIDIYIVSIIIVYFLLIILVGFINQIKSNRA